MTDDSWRLVPCKLWIGSTRPNGYGKLKVGGRTVSAHRDAWTKSNGAIPAGLCVCHKCDVKLCTELQHLFLGTHAENQADMTSKGRGRIGDRNGSRTKPERLRRGDAHHMRQRPELALRGELSPNAKLSPSDVLRVRTLRSDGYSQARIASVVGIGQSTVSRVLRRQSWGHVQG